MKVKLNNEYKAKFFAQYWGQIILSDGIELGGNVGDHDNGLFLELISLRSLTKRDADIVGNICGFDMNPKYKKEILSEHIEEGRLFPLQVFDYLRSKGYAAPWMGLSVKRMIKEGWIKLKEI